MIEKENERKLKAQTAKAMADKDLFSVNVNKEGLGKKRAKLAKDRFEQKDVNGHLKSKVEELLLKRLRAKNPS